MYSDRMPLHKSMGVRNPFSCIQSPSAKSTQQTRSKLEPFTDTSLSWSSPGLSRESPSLFLEASQTFLTRFAFLIDNHKAFIISGHHNYNWIYCYHRTTLFKAYVLATMHSQNSFICIIPWQMQHNFLFTIKNHKPAFVICFYG